MSELIDYKLSQLPDNLEDLTQFVLVGKAKLNAYMLKLQTVNKLSTAQEIRDQTLKEAQDISTALIAAEQRIGEILLRLPKASGGDHGNQYVSAKNPDGGNFGKSKSEAIKDMGYDKHEVSDYQTMAKHPEVVQKVIEDALSRGEVVTKTQVLKEIKAAKKDAEDAREEVKRLKRQVETLESKEPETVEVVPDDYESLKKDVNNLRKRAEHAEKERRETNEKLNAAQKKIRDYESREDILEMQKRLEEEAGYFAIRTYDYIQKNGGNVWITEKLNDLPENKRKDFIASIYAIDAFAKQMVENIGGYNVE